MTGSRKGAVKKREDTKTTTAGATTWTKRGKATGEFMAGKNFTKKMPAKTKTGSS